MVRLGLYFKLVLLDAHMNGLLERINQRIGEAVIRIDEHPGQVGDKIPSGKILLKSDIRDMADFAQWLVLPFADDDPRTAEIVSKTLLLARDDEIDDPIILEQLRAM